MQGKEVIIKKIIDDANEKAQAVIKKANDTASLKIADAKDWAENYLKAEKSRVEKEAEEIIKRKLTLADLDLRKITLKTKQEIISIVLEDVYKKLCALPKSEYLKFIDKLLNEFADKGDEIYLSRDGILEEKDIRSLKVFGNKSLMISSTKSDFFGGIYLIGKTCDKNLSFKAIIDSQKDRLISELAEVLF